MILCKTLICESYELLSSYSSLSLKFMLVDVELEWICVIYDIKQLYSENPHLSFGWAKPIVDGYKYEQVVQVKNEGTKNGIQKV